MAQELKERISQKMEIYEENRQAQLDNLLTRLKNHVSLGSICFVVLVWFIFLYILPMHLLFCVQSVYGDFACLICLFFSILDGVWICY